MGLTALVLWIFLALLIGWIGLILAATWRQVREERARAAADAAGPPASV